MTTSPTTPAPDSGHDAPAKRVLWKWSVAFTALILVFLMWRCGSALVQGRKLADAAVRHFHQRLNAGDYEDIYREADEGFRTGQSHDESIRFLETVHKKLGLAGQEIQLNVRVDTNTRGTFLTTQYSTAFATGTATEMFTWVKSSGTLKLSGYHIQSNALILNEEKPAPGSPGTVNLKDGTLHPQSGSRLENNQDQKTYARGRSRKDTLPHCLNFPISTRVSNPQ